MRTPGRGAHGAPAGPRLDLCPAPAACVRRVLARAARCSAPARDQHTVPSPVAEPAGDWPEPRARRRRWAELLRLVYAVDVEVCVGCGGAARIVGLVTAPRVIRRILDHLKRRGIEARAGPWEGAAAARG